MKKKLFLSGLNCNIVFYSISLTQMFTNEAQGSRPTPMFSAGSSNFSLSVYEEHRVTKPFIISKQYVFFYHLMFLYSTFYI